MIQKNIFDFESLVERRNTGSYKWDVEGQSIPLWVADMDFDTAPVIKESLLKRAALGAYGYSKITDEWYEAYISWWKRRYSFEMKKDSLVFSLGVVPSLSSILRRLLRPNENVILLTPCYNIFYNSILNNGFRVLSSPLRYENYSYSIDFDDLEDKMAQSQSAALILSNPQNPTGNIWTQDDLERISKLAKRHDVIVISDEIHCDITRPGLSYVPFLSVSKEAEEVGLMLISPTKSFNIAGLLTSALYIPNRWIRKEIVRGLNNDEIAEPALFSALSAVSAYNGGEPWLEELRRVIEDNKDFASDYINRNIDGMVALSSDATYLLWVDVSKIDSDDERLSEFIFSDCGVKVAPGSEYGSSGFLRINTATPKWNLERALNLISGSILKYRG